MNMPHTRNRGKIIAKNKTENRSGFEVRLPQHTEGNHGIKET